MGPPASKPKPLTSNAVWNFISKAWGIVLTFFLTPFIIAKIGVDYYGLLMVLLSVTGFLGIMNFGLGEATLRHVAMYYARNDSAGISRVVGSTFFFNLIIGLSGWAIIFFSAKWLVTLFLIPGSEQQLVVGLIRITSFSFGITLIDGTFNSIPQALQRYDITSKITLAQSVIYATGVVLILTAGFGIYELVFWNAGAALILLTINFSVARRILPDVSLRPYPSSRGLREVFGYGIFALLTNIFFIIWSHADRLLLAAYVNMASVGFLSVPQNVCFKGINLVGSISDTLFPRFSAMDKGHKMEKLYLDSTWVMLVLTIVIFTPVTIMMPDFLRLWISPEFSKKSAWIGQILAFSYILRGAFHPYQLLFGAIGKPKFLTVQTLISALVGLSLNLLLIPRYGLVGAGYCYLATISVGFAAIIFTCKYVLALETLIPLIRIILQPLGLAMASLAICHFIHQTLPTSGWGPFILQFALFAVITGTIVAGSDYLRDKEESYAQIIINLTHQYVSSALSR